MVSKNDKPELVNMMLDPKTGVAFFEAKYGRNWGCPVCLEFLHIDGQRSLFGHCSCTKARIQGQDTEDPSMPWNQPDYQPDPYKRIDWENVGKEVRRKRKNRP